MNYSDIIYIDETFDNIHDANDFKKRCEREYTDCKLCVTVKNARVSVQGTVREISQT